MPAPLSYQVVLLRPELALLWFTVPMLAIGSLALFTGWSLVLGFVFTFAGAILSMRLWLQKRAPETVRLPGSLTIDAQYVIFEGAWIAKRRSLRAGFIVSTPDGLLVRLVRAFPLASIDVEVRKEEDGRALLIALGLDATQVAARFRLGSLAAVRAVPLVPVLVFWGVVSGMVAAWQVPSPRSGEVPDPTFFALWALGLAAWLGAYFKSTSFVVGADGIHVRWLWTRRFIGHGEIVGVGMDGFKLAKKGLLLELSRGPALRFRARATLGRGYAEDEASAIVGRVQQALDLFRRRQRAGDLRLPDRGDRPVAAWIQALRGAGSAGAVDHRTAPRAVEDLWLLAEDPGAERVNRAGAAVALGAALDAAGKQRLRIAAVATAAPDLREVLEAAAAEADEARLSRALARLTKG